MKKIYFTVQLCLTQSLPYMHRYLPNILQTKRFVPITYSAAMHPNKTFALDGLSSLPTWAGRKHHLAELFHYKATDRSSCAMRPVERLFIQLPYPRSFRNGWKQMKPKA